MKFKLDKFLIDQTQSIKDALVAIEKNKSGCVFVVNKQKKVLGLLTDGDIRRLILNGNDLSEKAAKFANRSFQFGDQSTPRETILKKLNDKIHILPILDNKHKLIDVLSRDYLPLSKEKAVYSQSKAPVRISFGGGGSDLTHFFKDNRGAVINTTISKYSHATLHKRDDKSVFISSLDLDESIKEQSLEKFFSIKNPKFDLIKAVLKTINPSFGFNLYLYSDFPMSSGLGGSASVSASIFGCFNEFREDQWSMHDLAELCFQAERLYQGVEGGWQDQYAAVFGGVNFMEFKMDQNIIHPLRLSREIYYQLESCLVLCNTGISHNSGNIHNHQRKQMKNNIVKQHVKENVELCFKMRDQLLRGKLEEFGESLNSAWNLKKKLSSEISSKELDLIYDGAIKNGAIGGKLLGAGGGGFFLFYVHAHNRSRLISHLKDKHIEVTPFSFEQSGLTSWKVRQN
jgi:D-glycero-alpha-D-manno-heptose-7-phosphate kinase